MKTFAKNIFEDFNTHFRLKMMFFNKQMYYKSILNSYQTVCKLQDKKQ